MKLYDVLASLINTIKTIQSVPSVSSSTNGKFLKSSEYSYSWEALNVLPTGGSAGNLLKKTDSGAEWSDESTAINTAVTVYMEEHYENGDTKEY